MSSVYALAEEQKASFNNTHSAFQKKLIEKHIAENPFATEESTRQSHEKLLCTFMTHADKKNPQDMMDHICKDNERLLDFVWQQSSCPLKKDYRHIRQYISDMFNNYRRNRLSAIGIAKLAEDLATIQEMGKFVKNHQELLQEWLNSLKITRHRFLSCTFWSKQIDLSGKLMTLRQENPLIFGEKQIEQPYKQEK